MNSLYDMMMMGGAGQWDNGMGDSIANWGAGNAPMMQPWQPVSWGQPYQARNDIGVASGRPEIFSMASGVAARPYQTRNDIGYAGGGWANRPVSSGGNSAYGYASRQPLHGSVSNPSTDADRALFQQRLRAFRAAHPGGTGLTRVARNDPRARPVFGSPLPSGPRQARNDIGVASGRPEIFSMASGVAARPYQTRNDIGYAGGGWANRPVSSGGNSAAGVISPNRPANMRGGGSMGGASRGYVGSLGEGPVGPAGRQRGPDMWRRPAGGGSGRPEWGY